MQYFTTTKSWNHVEYSGSVTGKDHVGTRWVGVDKGDEASPEYRSRCVAQELNKGGGDTLFAGTPPLEAKNGALFDGSH